VTTFDRPFGRCFEDFEPGDVYRHWPGKTITEADDHLFCMITMNHHPLHTDAWFAEHETVHGKNVVVGNLVYSLVLGMSVPDVSGAAIANLEVESLVHRAPTFHGDTIYAETKVIGKVESKSRDDRGVVTVETKGFNQRGEEVCFFRRKVMVWKQAAAPRRQRPYGDDVLAYVRRLEQVMIGALAEHGVGRSRIKQQLLRDLYGDSGIDDMRRVKEALDPEWKLARGVIFGN